MPKLFVICGHGAGDPGACAHGYQEAERVRALGKRIKELGGSNVILADTNRNYYADDGISKLTYDKDAIWIVELHMDSSTSSSARGGHIIIKSGFAADKYDTALAKSISTIFPGRSQSIAKRSDLANVNRAAAKGYNYRLIEHGFISNSTDLDIFNKNIDKIAQAYLDAFGIKSSGSTSTSSSSSSSTATTKPATSTKKSLGNVDIQYALKKYGGDWWAWVKNFNNKNSDGYAGCPNTKHSAFKAKVTKGSIKYRCRDGKTGKWTGYVKDGASCSVTNWIDLIEAYYTTPSGYTEQQVWYRSQTVARAGWLGVVCDDGTSKSGYTDKNAGIAGEGMDRLQMRIASSSPF